MPPRSAPPSAAVRGHPRTKRRTPLWLWLVLAALLVALPQHLRSQLAQPLPNTRRVGVIAGHWQYDSGATCPDGLREVEITLAIAQMVVEQLKEHGYEAELLPEYSERLPGYQALALVSLHADSCLPELSGYKIAGRSRGPAAAESARLVSSLRHSYAAATGLGFHENTITPAMTHYYAFNRIAPHTPAAIVELGFMGGDRVLLTAGQGTVAQGVVEGLLEFLNAQSPTEG